MKTVICKPDLDTCLTALVLDVNEGDTLVCAQDFASSGDLADPSVRCIECGGSGETDLNNFDHHDPLLSLPPACRQACEQKMAHSPHLARLVDYVCLVDDPPPDPVLIPFPSLANLFSGMLMTTPGPEAQFWRGVGLLRTVLEAGYDPFASMPERPEWQTYLAAKAANACKVAEAIIQDSITFFTTASGLNAGCLSLTMESAALIVGPGALYGHGCEIAIIYSPAFGSPPVRKFTIAGHNRQVCQLLPHIALLEVGWGGREGIIGSPRNGGSHLPENTIIDLVRTYA